MCPDALPEQSSYQEYAMPSAKAPGKPDIIFFMLDQLSARWIEGQSADVIPTPVRSGLRDAR